MAKKFVSPTKSVDYISALAMLLVGLVADTVHRLAFISNNSYSSDGTPSDESGISVKGYYSLDAFNTVIDAVATGLPIADADYDAVTATPSAFAEFLRTQPDGQQRALDLVTLISLAPASQDTTVLENRLATAGILDNDVQVTFAVKPVTRGTRPGNIREILTSYGFLNPTLPSLQTASLRIPQSVTVEQVSQGLRAVRKGRPTVVTPPTEIVLNPLDKVSADVIAKFTSAVDFDAAKALFAETFTTTLPATVTDLAKLNTHVATLTNAALKV